MLMGTSDPASHSNQGQLQGWDRVIRGGPLSLGLLFRSYQGLPWIFIKVEGKKILAIRNREYELTRGNTKCV